MTGNALSHFIKYILNIDRAVTQTTQAERELLVKYCKGLSSAVEIGVFEGFNTVLLANAISLQGNLYGIDPFFKGKLGICYYEIIAKTEIKKAGLESKVKLISLLSKDAVFEVPGQVDFIFIDGDHSYSAMKQDWKDWSKKLKPNGIIALHDTSVPSHDSRVASLGSYKYFNEVIIHDKSFKIEDTVDSLNILRKVEIERL